MGFSKTILLLPCHSLEDFPTHNEGDEAEGLLSAWCCGWHPRILAATGNLPQWSRADDPPQDLTDKLIVIPAVSQAELPSGFVKKAREAGATVITEDEFPQMVDSALAALDDSGPALDEGTVSDFFALAYAYLQIELLTRQMRYACNLDEAAFADEAVAAARFALEGDEKTCFDRLSRGFDLIAEERDHYYSVEAFLLDITLVAPTTIGPALRKQVASSVPTTLLLTGSTLEEIARTAPDLLEEIRAAWDAGRISIAGGDYSEGVRFPVMSHEQILSEIKKGLATFQRLLGRRPVVYGRRVSGLTPALPQILKKLGFQGVFHFSLDDGKVPQSGQAKLRWEGIDGSVIDALSRPPQDANRPETYLSFAMKMGESMDMDFVATVSMAHWPGQTRLWHDLMQRTARFGPALGRFATADEYFEESASVGHNDSFEADRYTTNYLRQDIIRNVENPLSTVATQWVDSLAQQADAALRLAAAAVIGTDQPADGSSTPAQVLAETVTEPGDGTLAVNPWPATSRIPLTFDNLAAAPTAAGFVYAREQPEHGKRAVIDVPPVGFAWVGAGDGPTTANATKSLFGKKREASVAEDLVLRNEYFELRVHPQSGGIQSITPFSSRSNLITQLLAMRLGEKSTEPGQRWRDPDELAVYSEMKADNIQIVSSSPVYGAIESTGQLLSPDGEPVATFRQQMQVWRGSRLVNLTIDIDPILKLRADPWRSYIANRLAWGDEGATVTRSFHETTQTVDAKRFASPLHVGIDNGTHKLTLLPHGMPYHRLTGFRMLDSLLIVRGETRRSFRLSLGVDIPQAYLAACQEMVPAAVVTGVGRPQPDHAWLFHTGARNIAMTNWEPWIKEGEFIGVRCRMLETAGLPARAKVAGPRNFTSGRVVDLLGEPISDCPIEDGRAVVEIAPFEWSEVELRWTKSK
jgi:alpha-mannosidase